MPLLPRAMRPAVVVRRNALYKGVFGPSRLWKLVAIVVFGGSTMRRLFGRHPQVIDVTKFKGGGHLMQIETITPKSRRQRRRARSAA